MSDGSVNLAGKDKNYLQIKNTSDVDFELVLAAGQEKIAVPKQIVIDGNKTVLFPVEARSAKLSGTEIFALRYMVRDLRVRPNEGLEFPDTLTAARPSCR